MGVPYPSKFSRFFRLCFHRTAAFNFLFITQCLSVHSFFIFFRIRYSTVNKSVKVHKNLAYYMCVCVCVCVCVSGLLPNHVGREFTFLITEQIGSSSRTPALL
jgi:hypothetical protein